MLARAGCLPPSQPERKSSSESSEELLLFVERFNFGLLKLVGQICRDVIGRKTQLGSVRQL